MYVDAIAAERSEGRAKRGDSRGASRVPSGREMVPFLEVLDGMVRRGVEVRLIHAKEPDSPTPKVSGCPRERSG